MSNCALVIGREIGVEREATGVRAEGSAPGSARDGFGDESFGETALSGSAAAMGAAGDNAKCEPAGKRRLALAGVSAWVLAEGKESPTVKMIEGGTVSRWTA